MFQNKNVQQQSILILALIITGILLGYGFVIYIHFSIKDFKGQNLGFAVNSIAVSEKFQAKLISSQTPLIQSLKYFNKKNYQTILWLGASQLYTVTNPDTKPHTAVFFSNKKAQENNDNIRLIQYAAANTNLNELEIILKEFLKNNAIPDFLVLGMVYDDLREIGIRETIKHLKISNKVGNKKANKETLKQSSEVKPENIDAYIRDFLQQNFSPYAERSKIKAYFQSLLLRSISQIGVIIKGRPQVKIPKSVQEWNMNAFYRILKIANNNRIKILIYKAPHRPGESKFYHIRSKYDQFFNSFKSTLLNKNINYIDLELLVPKALWGGETQLGLPDVFHFQEEAHQLLGEKILLEIKKMDELQNGI